MARKEIRGKHARIEESGKTRSLRAGETSSYDVNQNAAIAYDSQQVYNVNSAYKTQQTYNMNAAQTQQLSNAQYNHNAQQTYNAHTAYRTAGAQRAAGYNAGAAGYGTTVNYATANYGASGYNNEAAGYTSFDGNSAGLNGEGPDMGEPKNPRKKLKIILGILIALLVALIVGVGVWFSTVAGNMQLSAEDEAALNAVLVDTAADQPYYVLLLGSDAREGDTVSRSDTMILARIDEKNAQVTLISIPRDTKVEIDGHGTQKINAAYAFGGAAGAVEAVSEFAGVDISHYVEIHFDELENIVDALGGITVDVPVANNQTGSSNTGVSIGAGEQVMDGATALAFARERYGYNRGDFQRQENQRLVVQALIDKILDQPATALPSVVADLVKSISTDYSLDQILALAQNFQQADGLTLYSCMAPSTTKTIDGVSYMLTKEAEWEEMMANVDAGYDPQNPPAKEEEAAE